MIDPRHSAYLAERIPGAKLVWLEGEDSLPTLGDTEAFLGEIEEFLTGGRRGGTERSLLTVAVHRHLSAAPSASPSSATSAGATCWPGHDTVVRREIERFGGREVKSTGDGFLIAFEGAPSRARALCRLDPAGDGRDRDGPALRPAHGRVRARGR